MKTALHSVSYAGVWPGQARLSLEDFLLRRPRPRLRGRHAHGQAAAPVRPRRRRRRPPPPARPARLPGPQARLPGGLHRLLHGGRPARHSQPARCRSSTSASCAGWPSDLGCNLVRVFTGFDHGRRLLRPAMAAGASASLQECTASPPASASRSACRTITTWPSTGKACSTCWRTSASRTARRCSTPGHRHCTAATSWRRRGSLAPHMVHTTVADYVRRPRFRYQPPLVNYVREADAVRAVPMGEGFIDYRGFLRALREAGFQGHVAYEMCSPLRGGGAKRTWTVAPGGFCNSWQICENSSLTLQARIGACGRGGRGSGRCTPALRAATRC